MVLPALAEIKMRREALGLTQKELAKKVTDNGTHVSRVLINMIENKDHYPNYKIVEVIFMVLDLMEISQRSEGKKKKTTAGEICNWNGDMPLVTVNSSNTMDTAHDLMGDDGQITQLPVLESGECVGLITQKSMLDNPKAKNVKDAMIDKPIVIPEDMKITPGLIELLVPPQSCILVSQHNSRKLKGVIVAWDLLHKKESMKQLRHQQEQKRV